LRGAGVGASCCHNDILRLAQAKLTGMRNFDSSSDGDKRMALMAVIDVQLSLDYEPRREKVEMNEATLVESYMRIAYSIPQGSEYLRSGYPSEPLLAEAAARQLWAWRAKNPSVVVETLTSILETGVLDRGELGELTGRLLLLDAYHRAVDFDQSRRSQESPPNFSAGCRLITFIKMLFKDAELILDSRPDNVEGIPFRDAFKDARVCFTHFGRMTDDTGTRSAVAWAAFVRRMGIICKHGERIVDFILPILMWDAKLCEHVISALLVQLKRREKAGTVAMYSVDEAEINFFPKILEKCTHGFTGGSLYRPYVSMVMELDVQPRLPGTAQTSTIYPWNSAGSKKPPHEERPRTPPPAESLPHGDTPSKMHIPQHGTLHDPKETHARYNIFAYGCSPTIYRGIDEVDKSKYALLLSSRDFLGEHPRNNEQSLMAVRMMKPFWSGGKACYHWVDDKNLNGPISYPREGLSVEVGMSD
jgi:hypothetical protein